MNPWHPCQSMLDTDILGLFWPSCNVTMSIMKMTICVFNTGTSGCQVRRTRTMKDGLSGVKLCASDFAPSPRPPPKIPDSELLRLGDLQRESG